LSFENIAIRLFCKAGADTLSVSAERRWGRAGDYRAEAPACRPRRLSGGL